MSCHPNNGSLHPTKMKTIQTVSRHHVIQSTRSYFIFSHNQHVEYLKTTGRIELVLVKLDQS